MTTDLYDNLAEFHDLFMEEPWKALRPAVREMVGGLRPEDVVVDLGADSTPGRRRSMWVPFGARRPLSNSVQLEPEPERVGHLEDRRPGRIAVRGERLVEPVATHPYPTSELAHVLRPGDHTERARHRGRVLRRVLEGDLEVSGDVIEAIHVVGSVEPLVLVDQLSTVSDILGKRRP